MKIKEQFSRITGYLNQKLKLVCGILLAAIIILGIITGVTLEKNNSISGNYESKIEKTEAELKTVQSQLDNKDTAIEKLQSDLKTQTDSNDQLQQKIIDANSKIEELSKLEDQQGTIDTLNQQIASLTSENESLKQANADLESQLASKSTAAASDSAPSDNDSAAEETVYWVSSGEVYHSTPNCSTLKRSSNIHSGTIAQSGKSRPCKVCH